MKKAILCFGNEFLAEDSLAKEIGKELKGFDVKMCNEPDDILRYPKDTEIIIVDVIANIDEVTVIKDVDKLQTRKIATMHDFDLGYFLKIGKATGELPKVRIIGIPMHGDKTKLKNQLISALASL